MTGLSDAHPVSKLSREDRADDGPFHFLFVEELKRVGAGSILRGPRSDHGDVATGTQGPEKRRRVKTEGIRKEEDERILQGLTPAEFSQVASEDLRAFLDILKMDR